MWKIGERVFDRSCEEFVVITRYGHNIYKGWYWATPECAEGEYIFHPDSLSKLPE
jgi:hypothetical protein